MHNRLPFKEVAERATSYHTAILNRLLPDGKLIGVEFMARNPNRCDGKTGSFSFNIRTGKWADFATDDKGGDIISLYAYLVGCSQKDALFDVAKMIGFEIPAYRESFNKGGHHYA